MRTVEELYRLQCQYDAFADQARLDAELYDEKAANAPNDDFRAFYLRVAESRRNSMESWLQSAKFYADEIKVCAQAETYCREGLTSPFIYFPNHAPILYYTT